MVTPSPRGLGVSLVCVKFFGFLPVELGSVDREFSVESSEVWKRSIYAPFKSSDEGRFLICQHFFEKLDAALGVF